MPGTFPSSGTIRASATPLAEPSAERPSLTTRFEVDQSQPTTSVQIRLADGTRLVCRMNLTHTVGDIRNFINAYVLLWFPPESLFISMLVTFAGLARRIMHVRITS